MPFNTNRVETVLPSHLIAAVKACQNSSAEELLAQIRKQHEEYREYRLKGLHDYDIRITDTEYRKLSEVHAEHRDDLLSYLVSVFKPQAGVFYPIEQFKAALFAVNTGDDPHHAHRSICVQIESRIDYDHCYLQYGWVLDKADNPLFLMQKWMFEQFKKWPQFSGDLGYPVPSPDMEMDAQEAYDWLEDEYWNPQTEYGRMRIDLLKFLQEQFSKEFPDV